MNTGVISTNGTKLKFCKELQKFRSPTKFYMVVIRVDGKRMVMGENDRAYPRKAGGRIGAKAVKFSDCRKARAFARQYANADIEYVDYFK